jgi:hypothetical protein
MVLDKKILFTGDGGFGWILGLYLVAALRASIAFLHFIVTSDDGW